MIKDFTMIVSFNTQHVLNGYSPISSYKKALLSIFTKKKVWNYINIQREAASKRKQALKKDFILDEEVIYH